MTTQIALIVGAWLLVGSIIALLVDTSREVPVSSFVRAGIIFFPIIFILFYLIMGQKLIEEPRKVETLTININIEKIGHENFCASIEGSSPLMNGVGNTADEALLHLYKKGDFGKLKFKIVET